MLNTDIMLKQLSDLSHNQDSHMRRDLLHKVTDLFFATADLQTDEHTKAFDHILEDLTYTLEVSVRAELADRIADHPKAPSGLVHRMADDVIEVSSPILKRSPILSDEYLARIAKAKGQEHLLAISSRKQLSIPITDILINRGNELVMRRVVENDGAQISPSGYDQLFNKSEDNIEINQALSKRPDIPSHILKQVKKRVEQRLQANPPEGTFQTEIHSIIDLEGAKLADTHTQVSADFEHIRSLHQDAKLSEKTILDHIHKKQLAQTIYCLSLMSDMKRETVKYCLLMADIPALAILCRALEFHRATFVSLLKLREHLNGEEETGVADALRNYDKLEKETAQRVLRFLKVRQSENKIDQQKKEDEGDDNEKPQVFGKRKTAEPYDV